MIHTFSSSWKTKWKLSNDTIKGMIVLSPLRGVHAMGVENWVFREFSLVSHTQRRALGVVFGDEMSKQSCGMNFNDESTQTAWLRGRHDELFVKTIEFLFSRKFISKILSKIKNSLRCHIRERRVVWGMNEWISSTFGISMRMTKWRYHLSTCSLALKVERKWEYSSKVCVKSLQNSKQKTLFRTFIHLVCGESFRRQVRS